VIFPEQPGGLKYQPRCFDRGKSPQGTLHGEARLFMMKEL
jgi:hypothetical protein